MKNIITKAFRTKALAIASLFYAGSLQAAFIDLTANNLKAVFTTEDVVNSAGDTVSTTVGTVSVVSTDTSGAITSKSQTFVQVPDGSGGTEQIVTQVLVVATPDGFGVGTYNVDKTTKVRTTPVLANGNLGTTSTVTTDDDSTDVLEVDLDLAPTTTFTPVDPNLDTPAVISAP
jgi:hypothetical protein